MRTTLTLDEDVTDQAQKAVRMTGLPFKTLINRALRIGIEKVVSPGEARDYRTKGRPMGVKPGLNYDNIAELLAFSEGEEHR